MVSELSPSDTELLQSLAEGECGKEIAVRLKKNITTIDNRIQKVMERLGAVTRAQAVAIGLRRGLIR